MNESLNDTVKRKILFDLKKDSDRKPNDLTKTKRNIALSNQLSHPYDPVRLKEGVVADTLKNIVLGAMGKHVMHPHPKKDAEKAGKELSKPVKAPKKPTERIEPTFDDAPTKSTSPPPANAGVPDETVAKVKAMVRSEPKPAPYVAPAVPLTLDPKAQKADEDRRKLATKTHNHYISALTAAASTNSPTSRESYLKMAHLHAQTMRNHGVEMNVNDDLGKLDAARKANRAKSIKRTPPPASA